MIDVSLYEVNTYNNTVINMLKVKLSTNVTGEDAFYLFTTFQVAFPEIRHTIKIL